MGIGIVYAFAVEPYQLITDTQKVIGIIDGMTALAQKCTAVGLGKFLCSLLHFLNGGDFSSHQYLTFGVITVAMGNSFSLMAAIALSFDRAEPLVATITGSITIFFALYFFRLAAITSISAGEGTIPIFTASGKIS